jgi:hypothetical protein
MKTKILILAIWLISCNTKQQPKPRITFLFDLTDSMTSIQELTESQVKKAITSDDKDLMWEGRVVEICLLTDVRMGVKHKFTLNPSSSFNGNEVKRIEEVDVFIKSITREIEIIKSRSSTKDRSLIFEKLFFELSEQNQEGRVIYCFSDLHQNSDKVSFYQKEDIKRLYSHDKKWFKKVFSNGLSIPNLKGAKIHFIYNSKSQVEDEIFFQSATLLKEILLPYNGFVSIQSSL